jgi:alpha-glucuronidase
MAAHDSRTDERRQVRVGGEGYDLWLRYRRIADRDILSAYRDRLASLHCPGDSRTLRAARKELVRGLEGLLGQAPPQKEAVIANALVIGTPGSNPAIAEMGLAESLKPLGKEGFLIRSASYEERPVTVIAANTDLGVLYGTFRFLQHMQQHKGIGAIDVADRPRLRYRVLNHWDSINGIVSRGYAGRSLWKWDELPETVSDRYTDYARACASVGINMNDPPRRPRYDPLSSPGHPFAASSPPEHVGPQTVALGVLHVSAPGPHPRGQVGRDAQLVIHLPQQLAVPPVEPPHA